MAATNETNESHRVNRRRLRRLSPETVDRVRLPGYRLIGRLNQPRSGHRYLLVFSHMRAGSTLLAQVLAHHDDIVGFGELFLPIRESKDLLALAGKCQARLGIRDPLAGRIVLDKILHDYLAPPDITTRLGDASVDSLVLLREPGEAIPSMMSTFGFSVEMAVSYYQNRVSELAQFADGSTAALTFADLTERSETTLQFLSEHLALDPPLTSQFAYDSRTTGDATVNIRHGRILNADQRDLTTDRFKERPTIEAKLLSDCQRLYDETITALRRRCPVPPGFAAGTT